MNSVGTHSHNKPQKTTAPRLRQAPGKPARSGLGDGAWSFGICDADDSQVVEIGVLLFDWVIPDKDLP